MGVNDPDWAQIGSTPFYAYKFAINDACWFSYHIPHDIVPDTSVPIYFHTHWISDGTETASVRWEYTYMYARGFGQDVFDTSGVTTFSEQAASGVAFKHEVTESPSQFIANLNEPDGVVYCRVRRVANTDSPQVDNTDGIYLLTADIHYQSTNIGTASKRPGFYIG